MLMVAPEHPPLVPWSVVPQTAITPPPVPWSVVPPLATPEHACVFAIQT